MKSGTTQRRRGGVLIYATLGLTAFVGIVSLAVDYGRVQLSKTELTSAVDAAAMAGATLINDGASYARAEAIRIGAANVTVGQGLVVKPEDVVFGRWDFDARTFDTASHKPNAVQVTGYLTAARGNAIPLALAGAVTPYKTWDATETATAVWVPGVNVNQLIYGTDNPFLAGAKEDTKVSDNNPHDSPDYAGSDPYSTDVKKRRQSPREVGGGLTLAPGMVLKFDSLTGTARHDPNLPFFHPDGETGGIGWKGDIGHNNPTPNYDGHKSSTFNHENGIHDVVAPINALVGVFIGPEDPAKTPVPTINGRVNADCPTDFSSVESRKRPVYRPQLKQLFFIGDGTTKDGDETTPGTQQAFIVPPGATKLVLANWDFYEWNNNAGERTVRINRDGYVVLVK